MDYQTQYQEYKALADAALNTYFADTTVSYHRLLEAMHYSLTAGGQTPASGAGTRVLRSLRRGCARGAASCVCGRDGAYLFAHPRRSAVHG